VCCGLHMQKVILFWECLDCREILKRIVFDKKATWKEKEETSAGHFFKPFNNWRSQVASRLAMNVLIFSMETSGAMEMVITTFLLHGGNSACRMMRRTGASPDLRQIVKKISKKQHFHN
jgi:hypothetical protein